MSTWKELRDNPHLQSIYRTRLEIIKLTREFFWLRGFVEADVPIALRYPGQEPYLNPVPVTFHDPNGQAEQFYLHTSPEFALKKLLTVGFDKVFSLTKCFRDFEAWGDGTHNTEFSMVEWYRAPGTMVDFMNDTEELFRYIGKKLDVDRLKYNGRSVMLNCHSERNEPEERGRMQSRNLANYTRDSSTPSRLCVGTPVGMTSDNGRWLRKTMAQIWKEYLDVDLNEILEIEEIRNCAIERGYSVQSKDAYEDLFFKIFLNEIEPQLAKLNTPLFIYEYPQQMCSLSRRCSHDPRYAERAELYIAGLEIANGFGELLDPAEQTKRLEADRSLRTQLGKQTWPVDQDFISALGSIPSPAAGIALGVDRMVLLFTGARSINEVMFQTVKDQLESKREH